MTGCTPEAKARDLERLAWHRYHHNIPVLTTMARPVAWLGSEKLTDTTLAGLLDQLDRRLGAVPRR